MWLVAFVLTKRADEANKTKSRKLVKLPRAEGALQAAMDERNLHWVPPPDWPEREQHDIVRVLISYKTFDMERVDKGLSSMDLKVQRHPPKNR